MLGVGGDCHARDGDCDGIAVLLHHLVIAAAAVRGMGGCFVIVLCIERPCGGIERRHVEREFVFFVPFADDFRRPRPAHRFLVIRNAHRREPMPQGGNGHVKGDGRIVRIGVRRRARAFARCGRLFDGRIGTFRTECGQRDRLGRSCGKVAVLCRTGARRRAFLRLRGRHHLPCAISMDVRLFDRHGDRLIIRTLRRKCEHIHACLGDGERHTRRERKSARRLAVLGVGNGDVRCVRCAPGERDLLRRGDLCRACRCEDRRIGRRLFDGRQPFHLHLARRYPLRIAGIGLCGKIVEDKVDIGGSLRHGFDGESHHDDAEIVSHEDLVPRTRDDDTRIRFERIERIVVDEGGQIFIVARDDAVWIAFIVRTAPPCIGRAEEILRRAVVHLHKDALFPSRSGHCARELCRENERLAVAQRVRMHERLSPSVERGILIFAAHERPLRRERDVAVRRILRLGGIRLLAVPPACKLITERRGRRCGKRDLPPFLRRLRGRSLCPFRRVFAEGKRNGIRLWFGLRFGDRHGDRLIIRTLRRKCEHIHACLGDGERHTRRERKSARRLAVLGVGNGDLHPFRCRPGERDLSARLDLGLVRRCRNNGRLRPGFRLGFGLRFRLGFGLRFGDRYSDRLALRTLRRKREHIHARLGDGERRARREREFVLRRAVHRVGDADLHPFRCRPGERDLSARRDLGVVDRCRDDGRRGLIPRRLPVFVTGGKRERAARDCERRRSQQPLSFSHIFPSYLFRPLGRWRTNFLFFLLFHKEEHTDADACRHDDCRNNDARNGAARERLTALAFACTAVFSGAALRTVCGGYNDLLRFSRAAAPAVRCRNGHGVRSLFFRREAHA